jgi:phosphatidylglycerophosphate synthase
MSRDCVDGSSRPMKTNKALVPNLLTGTRLALVPLLWISALFGKEHVVGSGLAVAAVTDVLDGRLARSWGVTSRIGSRMDAVADSLVSFSAIGWLFLLAPDVIRHHPIFFSAAPMVAVGLLWLEWLKFRKVADFHLTSGRIAGIAGYVFLIQLFIFGQSFAPLLYLLMALSWIVAIESYMIVRTHDTVDERMPSPIASYLSATASRSRGD